VNKRELSEILGISERSLTEWQAEGMPIFTMADARGQEHTYDTEACIRWWIERDVRRRTSGSSDDNLSQIKYQREVLALKRDLGALVEVSEVLPALEAWRDDVLATMVSVPERYAQPMDAAVGIEGRRQLLADIIVELREVMGSYEFGTGAVSAGGAGLPQSAEDQRVAVG
jgi:hypothetical protein